MATMTEYVVKFIGKGNSVPVTIHVFLDKEKASSYAKSRNEREYGMYWVAERTRMA